MQIKPSKDKFLISVHASLSLQQMEALMAYIQASKFFANPVVRAFAQALVTNQLGQLGVRPGASAAHCVLMDLTIHLAAVLLCGNQGILAPLQQLAKSPDNMQVCILSVAQIFGN